MIFEKTKKHSLIRSRERSMLRSRRSRILFSYSLAIALLQMGAFGCSVNPEDLVCPETVQYMNLEPGECRPVLECGSNFFIHPPEVIGSDGVMQQLEKATVTGEKEQTDTGAGWNTNSFSSEHLLGNKPIFE